MGIDYTAINPRSEKLIHGPSFLKGMRNKDLNTEDRESTEKTMEITPLVSFSVSSVLKAFA
jgi:hypothetical protein